MKCTWKKFRFKRCEIVSRVCQKKVEDSERWQVQEFDESKTSVRSVNKLTPDKSRRLVMRHYDWYSSYGRYFITSLWSRYVCDCPPGWRFDKAAAICVDERKELCYDEWDSGRCHRARPLQLGRPECCCSEGNCNRNWLEQARKSFMSM